MPGSESLASLFRERARRCPNAPAVLADRILSYADVDAAGNHVAKRLQAHGVTRGSSVVTCFSRSSEAICGLLGVMKLGAVYVPIAPDLPAARRKLMVGDAAARCVLTQTRYKALFSHPEYPPIIEVSDGELDSTEVDAGVGGDDAAWVLYTSGSTGAPKGVIGTHRGSVNRIRWMWKAQPLAAGEICFQNTAFGTVDSFWEIWGSLAAGAPLRIIQDEILRDPRALIPELNRFGIRRICLVPSYLTAILDAYPDLARAAPNLAMWVVSGEPLPVDTCRRFYAAAPHATMFNQYGLTETCADITSFNTRTWWLGGAARAAVRVPIGRPIDHVEVCILDDHLEHVPAGEEGELFVGGACLARGYVDPVETRQRFVQRRTSSGHAATLYRTGDRVRWTAEGDLEYLGRKDSQVKVRGYRVELDEVEIALGRLPDVGACAVVASGPPETRLTAFVTVSAGADTPSGAAHQLRGQLADLLPNYMIPADIRILDTLPRTATGKIDRTQLRALTTAPPSSEPAESRHEVALEWIREEAGRLLGQSALSADAEFFAAGGDSLLALRLLLRVHRRFGVEIPLQTVFEGTTLASLATEIGAAVERQSHSRGPFNQPAADGRRPLSFAQERLWILSKLRPDSRAYNLPLALRLTGPVDVDCLRDAIGSLLARHEVLRSVVSDEDGVPTSRVAAPILTPLVVTDMRHVRFGDASELERQIGAEVRRLFDLSCDVPLRATVFRLADGDSILLLVVHQSVLDDWSVALLGSELSELYNALLGNRSPHLPALDAQYADVSQQERLRCAGKLEQTCRSYWMEALRGFPDDLPLPTDYPRPTAASHRGDTERLHLRVLEDVRASAHSIRVTTFSWMLAAVAVVLARYCGVDDVILGVPFTTRRDASAEHLIGCFFNILPLRLRPRAHLHFAEFAEQVEATVREAQVHQDLPLERIVEAAGLRRQTDREPAIRVMVVSRGQRSMRLELDGVEAEPLDVHNEASEEDLTFRIGELEGAIEIECEYSTDLFARDTVRGMLGAAETVIRSAAADVHCKVGALPLVDDGGLGPPLDAVDGDAIVAPAIVPARVAEIAREAPSRVAVIAPDRSLTYGELAQYSQALAERLIRGGIGPEDRVAIHSARSAAMVVALLAVMKAGAAYVPLDPEYPAARLRHLLADSGARAILVHGGVPEFELPVIDITFDDASKPSLAGAAVHPDNLCNVMYTSGSTGAPKGVQVTHGALANLLSDMRARLHVSADDVFVASTTLCFDIAALELYLPLLAGGRVAVAPDGLPGRPTEFAQWLASVDATVVQATPSVWQTLVEAGWAGPRVRALCGGEPLTIPLAQTLCRRSAAVWNVYGPTETTIWSAAGCVTPSWTGSIGTAIRNTRLYVLDTNLMPLPVGVPGELYIGGHGVARGYQGQPDLTAARFLPDPFGGAGARMYATGDRCRQLTDGSLEFLGRRDRQIKVRGFRVEPGEIERVAERHPAVERAIVTSRFPGTPAATLDLHVLAGGTRKAAPAFSLFFFASSSATSRDGYGLYLDGARFADRHGFAAVWTPERHFHDVGGPYPSPSVLSAALSRITDRVQLRAGSVVLPLHQTIRVAEEWSIVDNLSAGRVGLAIASGWHPQDFAFAPSRFANRRETMVAQIDELRRLWRGEEIPGTDGKGRPTAVRVFPRPRQAELPLWLTASGRVETFETAGRLGCHVLTHLLEQDVGQLKQKIARYRAARQLAGFDAETGIVTLMLHAFVADSTQAAVDVAREPFCDYLRRHLSLETLALQGAALDADTSADEAAIIERAFERYLRSASLIGDAQRCLETIETVEAAGVDEIACFVDFGIGDREVLNGLQRLDEVRRRCQESARGIDTTAIHRHLERYLPGYMVPATILAYDSLPTTPAGKVDASALEARVSARAGSLVRRDGLDVITDATAMALARIWTDLLGVAIDRGDTDFFDAGGHSLLAAQLVSRIRRHFGVEMPIRTIFDHARLADLAKEVAARATGSAARSLDLVRTRQHGGHAPLSFAQERLAFLDRLFPGTCAYDTTRSIRLNGPLDEEALHFAVSTVVGRHELLRSRLALLDGALHWRNANEGMTTLSQTDVSGLPASDRSAAVAAAIQQEIRQPFDLFEDLPLRLRLLKLAADEHVLLFTIHHIVSDGWSLGILNRELSAAYNARRQGRTPSLPELPIQYGDYAAWQRERAGTAGLQEQLAFWRAALQGKPDVLPLPSDRPRPALPTHRGAEHVSALTADDLRAVKALAQTEGVTLFMILVTMLQVFLARYSGEPDVTIGTPVVDRGYVETEPLIGLFLNTIAMRLCVRPAETIRDALRRNREFSLRAYANQDVPFERVVEALDVPRDLGTHPVFQVMIVLRNVDETPLRLDSLAVEEVDVSTQRAKFDLTVWAEERDRGLDLGFEYSTDLFDRRRVEAMADHFVTFIRNAVATPDTPVGRVALLTADQRASLLRDSAGIRGPSSHARVHEMVSRRAAICPEQTAVTCGRVQITYSQLERGSNALARILAARGVRAGMCVGVCMTRSAELVVALLGILKAGAAFVAIDAEYPQPRIAFMIRDACIPLIVTERSLHRSLEGYGCETLVMEDVPRGSEDDRLDLPPVADNAVAYLIYTSGSTGTPKGVMIAHRSAAAMLTWARAAFQPWIADTMLASTSISFDLSIFEIFAPLIAGGTVAVVDNLPSVPDDAFAVQPTILNTVPSVLDAYLTSNDLPGSVRVACLAGERLTRRLVDRVYRAAHVEAVFNLYGPSECTTYSTAGGVARGGSTEPSIGRPIANTSAYVLDEEMQLVPVGVAGELYLGGDGVALGYWRRPDLTAERFVPDPFGDSVGGRLYATGDLVRSTWDGELEFLGRRDRQVKIRGFRVEPAEIESALADFVDGAPVAVVPKRWGEGDERLIAYVASPAATWDASALRERLHRRLPQHMVPSSIVRVPSLPLTANGKLDAARLPDVTPPCADGGAPTDGRVEEILTRMWADLLRVGVVSTTTNFFDAGGHSLLLIAMQARIREQLAVNLPMVDLFSHPTVRSLAHHLAALLDTSGSVPAPDDGEAAGRRAALQRTSLGIGASSLERLSRGN